MADTHETVADITAEMRDEAARADMEQGYSLDDAAEMMREFASRIDEAHKRDAVTDCNQFSDAAKLREALKLCLRGMCGYCRMDAEARGMTTECVNGCEALIMAKAALAAPPRNCDVGSVAEQKERFKDFCKEGKLSRIDLGAYCAYDCPCRDSYDCKLAWAQMPYREGVPNAE